MAIEPAASEKTNAADKKQETAKPAAKSSEKNEKKDAKAVKPKPSISKPEAQKSEIAKSVGGQKPEKKTAEAVEPKKPVVRKTVSHQKRQMSGKDDKRGPQKNGGPKGRSSQRKKTGFSLGKSFASFVRTT